MNFMIDPTNLVLETLKLSTGKSKAGESPYRFSDGEGFHFEFPSVENAMVEGTGEAKQLQVSQVAECSEIELLNDQEIHAILRIEANELIEDPLFRELGTYLLSFDNAGRMAILSALDNVSRTSNLKILLVRDEDLPVGGKLGHYLKSAAVALGWEWPG